MATIVPGSEDAATELQRKATPAWGLSTSQASLVDDEIGVRPLRQSAWRFLDDPSSGHGARLWSLVTMSVILFSVVVFCLESLPQFYTASAQDGSVWSLIETVCVALFTVEYLARLFCCPNRFRFIISPLNLIDLFAILPFYLEMVVQSLDGGKSAVFRVVRLVRVFRVFKISRNMSWIRIFVQAMAQSLQPLAMLLFVMLIGCVFFSSAMFYTERGTLNVENLIYYREDGLPSPFQSIPETFWWCIVTMTTVGYGDNVPITPAGKFLAGITSLTGILVLAIPITIISTNFNVEYERLKKQRKNMKARMRLLKSHFQEKTPGLDTYQHEVEDLIKRSSQDMLSEMGELIDSSKEEMVLELNELLKLAFKSRQNDLVDLGKGATVTASEE